MTIRQSALFPAALAASALSTLGVGARAQSSLYTVYGDSSWDHFGRSLAGVGDIDGDGRGDFVVGAQNDDDHGSNSGSARVFSGATGSVLYTFYGDSAGDFFGWSTDGAGDVDADGCPDVIVGAMWDDDFGNNSGSARVFSGATGSVLYTFYGDSAEDIFGRSVGGAGDVNADGYDDLIVGAEGDDANGPDSGTVWVFSGLDGGVLHVFHGDSPGDFFGTSVSCAGDVNADGYDDLIVGALYDDDNGPDCGSARVFSGLDGSELYTFYGDSPGDLFGWFGVGAGDVNADGFDDLVVGASGDDDNGSNCGSVRVLSGQDGSVLFTFFGDSAGDQLGLWVAAAGDFNADGYADVLAGAPLDDDNGADSGSARVFSGLDGSVLLTLFGDSAGDRFGWSVSGFGRANADASDDLIVGAVYDDVTGIDAGSVRVIAGFDVVGTPYCWGDGSGMACPCANFGSPGEGCANSTGSGGRLSGSGSTSVIADDLEFGAQHLLAGQPALLFEAVEALNNGDGFTFGDGLRCAGVNLVRLQIRTPDAVGAVTFGPGLAPIGGWSSGQTKHFQAWYRDPGGSPCGSSFNLTNGVEITFTQ